MKKMVSVILSVCLLLTLLPTTVFAADQTANAGAKIVQKSYDESTKILTVDMQIKLPNAVGITSVATMISYDSSKLTLLHASNDETSYIATETREQRKAAVKCLLTDKDDEFYTKQESALYGKDGRAALLVLLGSVNGPNDSQKTTDWLSIYSLRFKVSGPAATTLDSTSLRIADPDLENELVKYTYDNAHVNNYYTVAVVDGSTGLEYYFGKMKDNTEGELSGMKHLMAAAGNNTATYPGSTNQVTPPAPATYTVTVQNDGNGTASADKTTDVAAGETVTLTATPKTGYVFDKWDNKTPASLTIDTDGKFIMPSGNVSVKATFKGAALTGTVNITGTAKFGEELTATLTGDNNTGNLDYKWYQNDTTQVAANNTGKYTLRADDIGKTITVKITSSVQTGEITSAATATVAKADGPAAPSVTPVACTNSGNNDGKITGVNTTMEYSTVSDFTTKMTCTGSEITGLANGTYYVRVAETTTHKAGTAATVSVPAYTPGVLGGSASISGTAKYDEVLTAVTSSITGNTGTFSYQWKRSGTDITSATNSTYKLVEDDIGKTITVAITSSVESGTIVSSPTAAVEKADGPAAPSVTPVACTNSSNNDGKITGVNTTMEYSAVSDFATKTACTGSEITGLVNGTYYVRVAETTTHKAGAAANVNVPAYTSGALGGSASISGTAKYGEVLTAETASISGNTGTLTYKWYRGSDEISGATGNTYTLVEEDIGKTITVKITSSVESGTIVSSPTAAVEKADGPAAPSVTPVACTNSSNNDGKITGVNTTMEYQKSGAATWTACSGTEVTGLTNGTYYVRVAKTTTHKAGTAATVIVSAYTPGVPTEYTITFDVNGGSGTIPSQTTSGQKLSSLPTATHSGSYSFDGWYTAVSGGTQITTAYTFSADTTVYAHWTYTGGGGSYYAPTAAVVPDMPMLYRGCTGDAVKTLQDKLNALGYNSGNVDGIFGAKTYAAVTAFQKANSLGVDGIVGKLTWGKIYGVSPAMPVETTTVVGRPTVSYGSRGDAVRKLQELLNALGYDCGSVDGIFGSKTKAAVLAFQKANGLGADGIVGPLTWGKLV